MSSSASAHDPTPPPPTNSLPPPYQGGTKPFLPTTSSRLTRFTNYTRLLTRQLTPQAQQQYWYDYEVRLSPRHCALCEKRRDALLKSSPLLLFLTDNIQRLGGKLDKTNIRCRRCEPREVMFGAFHPKFGIKLCANNLARVGEKGVEEVLAHEMVHAWDYLRWELDWMGKMGLKQAACTEVGFPFSFPTGSYFDTVGLFGEADETHLQIRASSLSGECRFTKEFFGNGIYKIVNQHQNCVRRRAALSLIGRPGCKSKEEAEKAVDSVWDSCFADTRPFDEIY